MGNCLHVFYRIAILKFQIFSLKKQVEEFSINEVVRRRSTALKKFIAAFKKLLKFPE